LVAEEASMVNWKKVEDKLFKWSKATIKKFTRDHPGETVCFVAFDTDPRYGYVSLAFDTLENSLQSARELEKFAIKNRARNLTKDGSWSWAKYQLSTPVLSVFNTNSGDFLYQEYDVIEFPEWQKLAESGKYPKGEEHEDDYLEGNVRILIWKVSERLIETDSFASLKLAAPFMVGYGIHDQEVVILRILNWPQTNQ
jgi:hypothetical protein